MLGSERGRDGERTLLSLLTIRATKASIFGRRAIPCYGTPQVRMTLFVNRAALPQVGRRMTPVVAGLLPGIAAGTIAVSMVRPDWLKLWTFGLLLPLILLQAGGFRRPLRSERRWGVPFGAGVGALYSLTTISGPPLALFLNNQGLAKREFRASLGFIRLAEAAF